MAGLLMSKALSKVSLERFKLKLNGSTGCHLNCEESEYASVWWMAVPWLVIAGNHIMWRIRFGPKKLQTL